MRQTLNLSEVLDYLANKFAVVKLAAKLDCNNLESNDMYSGLSRRFTFIKTMLDARVAAEIGKAHPNAGKAGKAMGDLAANANASSNLNIQDDAWLNDLFNFGEYLFESYL